VLADFVVLSREPASEPERHIQSGCVIRRHGPDRGLRRPKSRQQKSRPSRRASRQQNNGKHHGDHHGTWNGGPRIKVGGNYTPIDLGNCYIRGVRTYDPFIGWYLTKKTVCG